MQRQSSRGMIANRAFCWSIKATQSSCTVWRIGPAAEPGVFTMHRPGRSISPNHGLLPIKETSAFSCMRWSITGNPNNIGIVSRRRNGGPIKFRRNGWTAKAWTTISFGPPSSCNQAAQNEIFIPSAAMAYVLRGPLPDPAQRVWHGVRQFPEPFNSRLQGNDITVRPQPTDNGGHSRGQL